MFIKNSDAYHFWSRHGYKSFWITDTDEFSEHTKIIIREHCLHKNACEGSRDLLHGMVKIQNCSFIIEATSSQHSGFSGIHVMLPAIDEEFANELLSAQYPQYSREWIKSYVSGFYMLKANVRSDFLNNFEFFDALCDNFNKVIDDSCFVSENVLSSLTSPDVDAKDYTPHNPSTEQQSSLITMLTESTDSKVIRLDVI